MGHAVPAQPVASRPPSHPKPFDGDDMRYALLIFCHEDTLVSDRERQRREEQFTAVFNALPARGVRANTQGLRSARAARTVRCWDGGDITITDGPAAQTREQLIGWAIAECE